MLSQGTMMWCLSALLLAGKVAAMQRQHAHSLVADALSTPEATFRAWADTHGKAYAPGSEEYDKRYGIWLDNANYIHNYNKEHDSHWLGLTAFADLSHQEFQQQYPMGFKYQEQLKLEAQKESDGKLTPFRYEGVDDAALPESIDWREKGAVTEVKNQQQCGSCWAFSTTGSIEGINFIKTGSLEVLSEQELIDCDHSHDSGCNGGLMDYAFQFIIDNGGIDTEKDYKYKAKDMDCNLKKEHRFVVTIDGYEDVPRNHELLLKKAVAHQPVSVAIQANERAFQLYAGGVLTDDCGTALDHGVLVVGYGRENNTDYWLVKNSWGSAWGEEGYVKLERAMAPGPGKCGIAMMPSYPVKEHLNPPRPPRPSPDPPSPPSPPPDGPVKCDDVNECMPHTTCCCMQELVGMCLQWACCPMPQATCCSDKRHCCPHNLPVCDVEHSRCLPKDATSHSDLRGEPIRTKLDPLRRAFGRGADAIRVA